MKSIQWKIFLDCDKSRIVTFSPEVKIFGISVHIVEPGFYSTHMSSIDTLNSATQRAWDRLPEATRQEYGEDYITSCGYLYHS